MRKLLLAAAALPVALLALPAQAANPSGGTLSATTRVVTWSGSADASNPLGCSGPDDTTCDSYALKVEAVAGQDVRVSIDVAGGDDWDLFVYEPDGDEVAASAQGPGTDESATFPVATTGTYEVRVQPYAVIPGASYGGKADFVPASDEGAMDVEPACPAEDVPHDVAPYAVDRGEVVSYDIAVLLDGVPQSAVEDIFERANPAYGAHGIRLAAASFTTVTVPGNGTADSTDTIDFARSHFGGGRPAGSDAVLLVTSKDLTDETLGSAVAGQVDCVGGVESAATSIAVAEVKPEDPLVLGPVGLDADISLKNVAHELGHLLGAAHHYGNCVEGIGVEDVSGDTAPCTLMFNVANFQSVRFSALNGAVIRGHALAYANR